MVAAMVAAQPTAIPMTKVLARELGPFGIRVNAIAPGMTDTPATREVASQETMDRNVAVVVTVDWGAEDLRDKPDPKQYVFHSFACVAQWALDRSLAHDGVTVTEGEAA